MKITIHRHGGFAGLSETVAVTVSSAQAVATVARLQALSPAQSAAGADFVHYDLLVDEAGRQSRISFADDGSEQAVELVGLVNSLSTAGAK